jgi:GNAT superfamily N-acetyltransferase
MPSTFDIRRATVRDADTIALHRAHMFEEMGEVDAGAFEVLQAAAGARLTQWLERGDYVGWVASPRKEPDNVVAGAGVQLQPILPRPVGRSQIGRGVQGTIVNVFTEKQWRRRGIATLLVTEIINWSRYERIDRLLLHASFQGRSVYERLGFIANNEMRFIGETEDIPAQAQ